MTKNASEKGAVPPSHGEALELLRAFAQISSPASRSQFLDMVKSLSPNDGMSVPDVPPRHAEVESAGVRRVLIVDDASDVLVSIGGFLEADGIDVRRADSGPAALKLLDAGEHIDAVVTDYAMPGMSGVDFLRQARRRRPDLPALVITGFFEATRYADLPPGVEVLRKPFRRKEFITRVRALLIPAEAPAQGNLRPLRGMRREP